MSEALVSDKKYSWWRYDNEYISGWQYFGRFIVGWLLVFVLIGLYLLSVTAYKRSNSLQCSQESCVLWAIWGVLCVPLAFTPIVFFTNTVPHWYLWFKNGSGKTGRTQLNSNNYSQTDSKDETIVDNNLDDVNFDSESDDDVNFDSESDDDINVDFEEIQK